MSESEIHRDPRDAILTRRFELDDGYADIYVWPPIAEEEHYARCDWQIVGLGPDIHRFNNGVDRVQALTLALYAINTRLYTSDAWKEGRLTWLGMRDLDLPSLPGDRAVEGGYGPAELLSLPGWQAVVRIADAPMPYFAMSDEHLASLIHSLKAIETRLDTSPDEARTQLAGLIGGLLKQKDYYEAVCREAGLPPPPAGHDFTS